MTKLVPAWDKRTGKRLPNPVPESWLRKNTFPRLASAPPSKGADAQPDGPPTDAWNLDQLRAHADAQGIDLAGATKKADVLAAIKKEG